MPQHNLAMALPTQWTHKIAASEHSFNTWDGTNLFYRAWHPGFVRDKALILFHGGHEHSGRFQDLVEKLDLEDTSVFAWDGRGHGRSPGERGYAHHFRNLVRDADAFVRDVSETYDIPMRNIAVLGHSVGSVIVTTWLHDYAPNIRGAVLGSPAFQVKLYVPFALPALRLLQRFRPDAYVNSYVRPGMLTHDRGEVRARHQDPLISPKIAVRVLTSLFDTADRVVKGAGSITIPILLLSASSDYVVRRKAHRTFFENLGSTHKEMQVYNGFFHEVFHEKDRHIPIECAKKFIEKLYGLDARTTGENSALEPHPGELSRSLPWSNPKKYYYGITRGLLQTVGRLSTGIRLGWRAGFDSGRMLDYVYENQPQGWTPLGRWIDRLYLNSSGWRGIRERGRNLRQSLEQTIGTLRNEGKPAHVLDVAAGPGRYLLDTLESLDDPQVSALCRDMDEQSLTKGRQLAESRCIRSVRFEKGDAFDPDSFARLDRRPNVVVVSGLYELFDDNHMILRSLRAIHRTLTDDGFLIYTNQPHHPQLELIARTLINRDKQPWVMRPRSQTEMNRLVRDAGFEPMNMLIDDDGIFSVTVAVRRS